MIDFHYLGKKKMHAMRREIFKGVCYLTGDPCKNNYICDCPDHTVDFNKCPMYKSLTAPAEDNN